VSVSSRLAIATRGFRGGLVAGGGVIIAAEDIMIELQLETEAEIVEIIEAQVATEETAAEVVEIIDAEVD
jgi:hypothetical protein